MHEIDRRRQSRAGQPLESPEAWRRELAWWREWLGGEEWARLRRALALALWTMKVALPARLPGLSVPVEGAVQAGPPRHVPRQAVRVEAFHADGLQRGDLERRMADTTDSE